MKLTAKVNAEKVHLLTIAPIVADNMSAAKW